MVRAKPIPGYVYESSEEGTNTPITNGDEVKLGTFSTYTSCVNKNTFCLT